MNINKAFQLAYQYYQAGDLNQAGNICKKILKVKPNNIDVLHFLGGICYQLGDYDDAIRCIKKEIEITPSNADAFNNLGLVLQAKCLLSEAIGYFRKAITLKPHFPEAYYNLGFAYQNVGKTDEAIIHYRKAIEIHPGLMEAYNNIGILLRTKGHLEESITYLQEAIRINPKYANTYNTLGLSLQNKGNIDDAIVNYQKAINLNPVFADAYNNLGIIFKDKGQLDEAIDYYQKALHLNPGLVEAHINLGAAFLKKDEPEKAIMCYQEAIQKKPDFADAYYNLGNVLLNKGQFDEAFSYYQKAIKFNPDHANAYNNMGGILLDKGQLNEAEIYFRHALQIIPDYSGAYSNLLLYMNYNSRYNPQDIFSEHLRFAKQFAEPLYSKISPHTNDCVPTRRLRIGYISPDFRKHSVAYFIEPVLISHNREQFEIFCYSDTIVPDEVTKRIQEYSSQWRNIVGMSDEKAIELIRNDGIDILIDLAGHTAKNRMLLFARKPAPVQVSWIGYPSTTGFSTMDYKIVDSCTDPPGMTEQFYTEKLIRMPKSFLCYLSDKECPEVGPLPALISGHITFGSFNNFAKVSPEVVKLWTKILKSIPNSRLIMKAKSFSDRSTRDNVTTIFIQKSISAEKIVMLPPEPSIRGHLEIYNRIDIGLDTFPYNGTTTTCEAMWMGVPVITLAGNTHASRVGMSLLSNVGLQELIARSPDEYLEITVALSKNLNRLQSLRESLRDRMSHSPLTDARRFTANLEMCYRKMWERWCKSV
jgi:protein O-GlcNAc transferase